MAWHPVAKPHDIEEGASLLVKVGEEPIALYKIAGKIYATHDLCTHGHAFLHTGYIENDCVECPLHQGLFHIPTGKAVSGPVTVDLKIYPVRVEDGAVLIGIED